MLLLGLLLSIVASGTAAAATGFQNPVVPQSADGADSPDPWIFVEGNRYFLTYTSPGRIEIRSARSLAGLASAKPRVL
jgi:GH43 family beta-xylosidase